MEEENKKKSVPQKVKEYAMKINKKIKEHQFRQMCHKATIECFKLGEISRKYGEIHVYPQIKRIGILENGVEIVLNLPRGFNPDDVEKKQYVFEQEFGQNIVLKKVSAKTFVLYVYSDNPLKENYKYDYRSISEKLKQSLPIYIGRDARGKIISYDMVEEPNLLIAGEPGSGKSVTLRSILTTLIFNKTPEELKLYLFDLKKSEFFLFKRLPHVVENTADPKKIESRFKEIVKEVELRGDLLEQHEVPHINKLPKEVRPPYIIACIDEFSLIKKETVIDSLHHIAAVGRALGVYLILSTQRPDKNVVDGRLKVLLTVRIGGRMQDGTNSRIIIDENGCETITIKGHMKMKYTMGIIDVKTPYLDEDIAKVILEPYKVEKPLEEPIKEEEKPSKKSKKKPISWGVLK
jgi:S-DNA-T family DNA segregation ATPase FtsK/SpoIIIE